MSLESNIAELVKASNALTGTVNGKIADIDRRVDVKVQQMEDWRNGARQEFASIATQTIAVGGAADHWYPVVISLPSRKAMDIFIARYTHEDSDKYEKFNGAMFLHLCGVNGEWGGVPPLLYPQAYSYKAGLFEKLPPVADFGITAFGMKAVVWLLGARHYNVTTSVPAIIEVFSQEIGNVVYDHPSPQYVIKLDALQGVSGAMVVNGYLRGA
ncbi:hypothetical protein [Chromobacterium sp.]|uniref:hypothetical protein n=1 Tax=Chromobacterium sp. TaxID=306190 RepID=UPI0035B48B94